MRMHDFLSKFDVLSREDELFQIPLRKEFLMGHVGTGKKVLDVGCLGGQVSQLLLDRGNEVFGIELNHDAAKVAESRGVSVKVANVEEGLPFGDAEFDVVNAGEVLEHLYDTKFFFKEAHRVLKPDGFLIFTAPNLNSVENRVSVFFGGYLNDVGAYPEDHHGSHVRVFNVEKIEELCDHTGFEIEIISGVPWLGSSSKFSQGVAKVVGRVFPSLSRLLMVKAKKRIWN